LALVTSSPVSTVRCEHHVVAGEIDS
jgi:hypothetical protein